jgi:predicted Zn finger-like uncharacterized protein
VGKILFRCPHCKQLFRVDAAHVRASGGKGKHTACGNGLVLFMDGKCLTQEEAREERMKRAMASGEPTYEVRSLRPGYEIPQGAFLLEEIRALAASGTFTEADAVREDGGVWGPVRYHPQIMELFHKPEPAPVPAAPPQASPAQPDRILWELKSDNPKADFSGGPYDLDQVREFIVQELFFEWDMVRPAGGDWMPAKAYPRLAPYFAECIERLRQLHGDHKSCAVHREREPKWQCLTCQDYLCEECVVNRPLVVGGASNYFCIRCERETRTLTTKRGFL